MFELQSFGLDIAPQSILLLVYCLVDNTLFEVSPEIRCSVCQVATVVMATMQLVLRPILKLFTTSIKN